MTIHVQTLQNCSNRNFFNFFLKRKSFQNQKVLYILQVLRIKTERIKMFTKVFFLYFVLYMYSNVPAIIHAKVLHL